MLIAICLTCMANDATVSPDAERMGLYAISAIVGLIVAGLITCAKEVRPQRA